MTKYYITGLIIVVLTAIYILKARKNKQKTTVIGRELADAAEAEQKRVDAGNVHPSPLSGYDYSKWVSEQSLINPLENELDSTIMELCAAFKASDTGKRAEIRSSLNQDNIYTLLEFSKRSTIFGIRRKNKTYVAHGFTAIAMIDAERCDYRDLLVALSFLNFGVRQLGLDEKPFVQETIQLADGKTKKLTGDFFKLSEKERSLEEMAGYIPIETNNGIGFIQTGYNEYNPKRNLAKILFAISDYVYSDKYLKGEITTGDDLPLIWLNAGNDSKIEKALSATSGTANLSTELRNDYSSQGSMQLLLVYLTEFTDGKSQQLISEHLNKTPAGTFKRIAFMQDNILCVIVQRALMPGLDDYESEQTLKRFEQPFRGLIQQNK